MLHVPNELLSGYEFIQIAVLFAYNLLQVNRNRIKACFHCLDVLLTLKHSLAWFLMKDAVHLRCKSILEMVTLVLDER
jgi:hypothetical protein